MGIFTVLALFLKPLHSFVKLNLLLHIRNIFLVFSHCDRWFGFCFCFLFIFLWKRKPWLDNFLFIITLERSKLWIWMGIYFRDILLIRISRGANNCVKSSHLYSYSAFNNTNSVKATAQYQNRKIVYHYCVQRVFEKKLLFHNDIYTQFKFLLSNVRFLWL